VGPQQIVVYKWSSQTLINGRKYMSFAGVKKPYLAGGFNPSEKYWPNWKSSPSRGENKKYQKPPPSLFIGVITG